MVNTNAQSDDGLCVKQHLNRPRPTFGSTQYQGELRKNAIFEKTIFNNVKSLSVAVLLASGLTSPALAGGYTSTITDTVKLDVQGAGVQSVRTGSSYAVSGTNVEFTGNNASIGGLSSGGPYSGATPATVTPSTAPSIVTPGSAFSFSESAYVGDAVNTSAYTPTSGVISPKIYGNSTVSTGGSAGSLAGSLSAGTTNSGVGSITAGGPGTSATLQRTIDLTVFQ